MSVVKNNGPYTVSACMRQGRANMDAGGCYRPFHELGLQRRGALKRRSSPSGLPFSARNEQGRVTDFRTGHATPHFIQIRSPPHKAKHADGRTQCYQHFIILHPAEYSYQPSETNFVIVINILTCKIGSVVGKGGSEFESW
jgi:hypothetical protein